MEPRTLPSLKLEKPESLILILACSAAEKRLASSKAGLKNAFAIDGNYYRNLNI